MTAKFGNLNYVGITASSKLLGLEPSAFAPCDQHTPPRVLDPALDLRRRQIERPTGLSNSRLALDDLDNQRRLPLHCSSFDALVHRHTDCYFPLYSMSRFSVGHYSSLTHNFH
jgi:hypothetical protein